MPLPWTVTFETVMAPRLLRNRPTLELSLKTFVPWIVIDFGEAAGAPELSTTVPRLPLSLVVRLEPCTAPSDLTLRPSPALPMAVRKPWTDIPGRKPAGAAELSNETPLTTLVFATTSWSVIAPQEITLRPVVPLEVKSLLPLT